MALGQIDDHIFAIAGESVNDECTRSIPVIDVERLDAGAGTVTGGGGSYSGAWAVEQSLPSTRFRFVGASHKAIYLFGGQRAWVDDLDGNGNGGFPVIGALDTPPILGAISHLFLGSAPPLTRRVVCSTWRTGSSDADWCM